MLRHSKGAVKVASLPNNISANFWQYYATD